MARRVGGGNFLVTARIEAEVDFASFNRALEVSVNKALVEWGLLALEAIRAEARVGSRDDFDRRAVSPGVHLKDGFQVATLLSGITASATGLATTLVAVWTDNPNAIWQELGTRQRRKKKLKNPNGPRNTITEGNRGVRPSYFMRRASRKVFPEGLALVQRAIENVGLFGGGVALPRAITDRSSPLSVDTSSPHFFRNR